MTILNIKPAKALFLGTALIALTGTISAPAYSTEMTKTETVAAASVQTPQTLATGQFEGRSKHVTSGEVKLVQTATGYQLVLGSDFYLDNAPDPIVAFGNDETFVLANKVSRLNKKRGAQIYDLPANFSPTQFSQAYIWCEKFDLPLGIADLNKV